VSLKPVAGGCILPVEFEVEFDDDGLLLLSLLP
jgi:hypothetical protein